MGGYVPNFTQIKSTLGPSSSSSSLPTLPGSSASLTAPPTNDFTFASGGALPNQNKIQAQPTIDPALTNSLLNFLHGQIGQGLPAFNQSVDLPSGGKTQPGQLSAGMNPILQQLQDFMSGKSGPGSLPGVMPMWQSEMEAMQGPIEQNMANLREQFGARGALGSSELGSASMDYMSQVSADQMALLTSATQAALPQMASIGMDIQGVDQASINRAYQQFMTDLPQANPLMGDIMQMGTMTPGTYTKPPSFMENLTNSIMGNLGGIAKTAGSAINAAIPGLPGWASIALGA